MTAQASTAGEALRRERESAGWTAERLARAIDCSKSQLSLMESGDRTISVERAKAIEKALKIRDGRLVDAVQWEKTPQTIRSSFARSAQEKQAIRLGLKQAFDKHDPQQSLRALRKLFRETSATDADDPLPIKNYRGIPLINKVAAGYPREFTDLDYPASIADEYVACPDVNDQDAFAARVVGDSMAPDYREGDIVVFSPLLDTPPGSDCFVRLERDNQTTFKRVYFEDDGRTIRLQPLNNAYPPRFIDREDIGGMYAAVYVMRRIKNSDST